MTYEVFQNISKIIERDSKSTTYKFALLRGVIDIIQENSPFIIIEDDRVEIPTGLLVEKWLVYYYPILESSINIPQIYGSANLAFENQFKELITKYSSIGGFSAFYNDLMNKGIPTDLQSDFYELVKSIRSTIVNMPMKYIGRSINENYYSIFLREENARKGIVSEAGADIEYLIRNSGTFSIPKEYYDAFKVIGSFLNGQDSLLFKWAEFSVNASGKTLPISKVVDEILKSPITTREVEESKKIYKTVLEKEGNVFCVWTGDKIRTYDIDHMIPFSVWKNNDLWNLLPATPKINNQKRDKIPSPELIFRQRDLIIYYWELLNENYPQRFKKEIQVALLGYDLFDEANWQEASINQLQDSCEHLISSRGFEAWDYKKTTQFLGWLYMF